MYLGMSFNDSAEALGDCYRLFLVPGAPYCSTNDLQASGPFPQTILGVIIDWVENGVVPTTLNARHLAGVDDGQSAQVCAWPLRRYWTNNWTIIECQYDQTSINTWLYDFDAIKMPVY
jgi:tannase